MKLTNAKTMAACAAGIILAAMTSGTFAHGSGSGESEQMPKGHMMKGKMMEGHVMKMDVDYSDVEEHEFGRASDPAKAKRTIEIDMNDGLRFEPSTVEVKPGETIRFIVRNSGKMMHEMVLGTEDSLHEHAMMMKKFPGMEHSEPHMAHVKPGAAMEMGWKFTKPGEYSFGCLVPGHFDGGMKGKVIVR